MSGDVENPPPKEWDRSLQELEVPLQKNGPMDQRLRVKMVKVKLSCIQEKILCIMSKNGQLNDHSGQRVYKGYRGQSVYFRLP